MPSAASAAWARSSAGISATQGGHQVAQRLISKPFPAKSATVCGLPSASVKLNSGSGFGADSASFAARALRPRAAPARVPAAARATARRVARSPESAAIVSSNSQWGGRFAAGPSAIMQAINASIGFDRKMWRQDIRGSLAHAAMLSRVGIISSEDEAAIRQGLEAIAARIEAGDFPWDEALEDIHMN